MVNSVFTCKCGAEFEPRYEGQRFCGIACTEFHAAVADAVNMLTLHNAGTEEVADDTDDSI